MELTRHGFAVYSIAFMFMGINVLASAFFTALGNGLISALISFLRTLLFQVAAVLLLPQWLGIDGIWLAITAALGRIALCHDMVSQFNLFHDAFFMS